MLNFTDFVQIQLTNRDQHADVTLDTYIGKNQQAALIHLLHKYISYCAVFPKTNDERTKNGDVLVPVNELLVQMNILAQYLTELLKTPWAPDQTPEIISVATATDPVPALFTPEPIQEAYEKARTDVIKSVQQAVGQYHFRRTLLGKATSPLAANLVFYAASFIGLGLSMHPAMGIIARAATFVGMVVGGALWVCFSIFLQDYKTFRQAASVGDNTAATDPEPLFKAKAWALNSVEFKFQSTGTVNPALPEKDAINILLQRNVVATSFRDTYATYDDYKAGKGLLEPNADSGATAKPLVHHINLRRFAKDLEQNLSDRQSPSAPKITV